ncbi:hypothetical protein DRQ23_02915 [bacterium]|nr:MAG: hypothetical protein DRQ23_02915 [bacterium]
MGTCFLLITVLTGAFTKPIRIGTLKDTVVVYEDKYGIPHIYAKNILDLVLIQGWFHARDRLWSMEMIRRTAFGRLSEIFGKRTLYSDIFLRRLGFHRMTHMLYSILTDEEKEILKAYADGVNAYIKNGSLPIEYRLLRIKPEPWKPIHSVAYIRLMAWDLNSSWARELSYMKLKKILDPARFSYLIPVYPEGEPVITGSIDDTLEVGRIQLSELIHGLGVSGSNSWVVSGKKTATGKPILCNDPHLSFDISVLWYEVHLNSPGVNLYGVSLPCVPFAVIGHTDVFAWGVTNIMTDDGDFIIHKVNPEDSTEYWTPEGWNKFEVYSETIYVKGRNPYILKVRWTDLGPVVSDAWKHSNSIISFRWTAYEKTHEFTTFRLLPYVKNPEDFLKAVSYFKVPGQNFVYADTMGNILYVPGVGIPERPYDKYILPITSDSPGARWTRFVPFEKIPYLLNPEKGFIVTANNKNYDNFPYYITLYYEKSERAKRITNLLSEKHSFTIEHMKKIQLDVSPPQNSFLRDIFVQDIEGMRMNRIERKCFEILKKWNLVEDRNQPAPLIFYTLLSFVFEGTYRDELGKKLYLLTDNSGLIPLINFIKDEKNIWFDNVKTRKRENRRDIVRDAFANAVNYLVKKLGKRPEKWKWGKLHYVYLEHAFGKGSKLAGKLFNRGPYPIDGSDFSVRMASFFISRRSYRATTLPSTRQIVDLGNLDASLSVLPTGNSGRPFSRHYDDQIRLWLKGAYHPAYISKEKVEEFAVKKYLFLPAKHITTH